MALDFLPIFWIAIDFSNNFYVESKNMEFYYVILIGTFVIFLMVIILFDLPSFLFDALVVQVVDFFHVRNTRVLLGIESRR